MQSVQVQEIPNAHFARVSVWVQLLLIEDGVGMGWGRVDVHFFL